MEHFCKVIMLGRATADPVTRQRDRANVVAFGFVYNERVYRGSQWVDDPCFIDCETASDLGEYVSRKVRKGYLVMVEGRLRRDEWTDAAKVRHVRHKIVLTDVKIMERPKKKPEAEPAQSSEPPAESLFGPSNAPPEDHEPI